MPNNDTINELEIHWLASEKSDKAPHATNITLHNGVV